MNGWMDRWMHAWMNGWMDGWINLINSNYNKLLILPFLSKQIIKYGKILYHSTKSNLVNEKKCIFNYKSNIYKSNK